MRYIKKNLWPILGGLVITFFVLFLQLSGNPAVIKLLGRLDAMLYDARLSTLLDEKPDIERRIKIIDIDERSLHEEGRWPWSRKKVAFLIDALANAGAKVVAFDVIFSEPELNSAEKLIDDLALRNALSEQQQQTFSQLIPSVSNDEFMAQYLDKTTVVLGAVLHDESVKTGSLGTPMRGVSAKYKDRLVMGSQPSYTGPLKILQEAASGGVAFVNAAVDDDGLLRRSPLVLRHQSAIYPSLSLAAAMHELGVRPKPIYQEQGPIIALAGILLGDYMVPTDMFGHITIGYQAGAYTYDYISATDVLAGKYPPGSLQDNILFVGTSALGLADLRSTPLEVNTPGVEIHAILLESMLEQSVPYKPSWEVGVTFLLILGIGFVLSFIQPVLKPAGLMIVSLLSMVALIASNFYLWHVELFDLTTITPVLLILLLSIWNTGYSLVKENSQRQVIKSMFGQYVPPDHVDLMLSDAKNYSVDGESREMSVMFADIRNFTSISESLSAADLKKALNRYFTPITQAIFDNQGTIDKYVGDMVMAFWGAPLEDAKHRKHAIDAAFAMLEQTEKLKPAFVEDGLPEFSIGIGINTGHMNVGDMGSEFRRAYTVLGDSVNLGSRIESLTKFYGAKFLVSEAVMDGVDEYAFLLTDNIIVKGKNEAIRVFQPMGLKQDMSDKTKQQMDVFHRALDAYGLQEWDKAIELLQTISEFKHLRDLYIERILQLQSQDLDADWDGVYRHTSK